VLFNSTKTVQLELASNATGELATPFGGVTMNRAVGENGVAVPLLDPDGPVSGGAPVSETVHAVIATATARDAQRISTLFMTSLILKIPEVDGNQS
jgi:hypothetical protein